MRLGAGLVIAAIGLSAGFGTACASGASSRPPPRHGADPVTADERWVDAHAPMFGAEADGTATRPFRSLAQALALARSGAPLLIQMRSGLYEGPFIVPSGVVIHGHGAVVLHAPADAGAVVTLLDGARLRSLHVQGGVTGIRVHDGASAALEQVKLSGQRQSGVEVRAGTLQATGLEAEGTITGTIGVHAQQGAVVELLRPTFLGGLDAGLRVEPGGRATMIDGVSNGPAHAIRSNGGTLTVDELDAQGGRSAAVGIGGGTARLSGLRVTGHEFALLVGGGADVEVKGLISLRADRAAIAIATSTARLEDVVVLAAGGHGAVSAVGSKLTLRDFVILGGIGYGLNLHGGSSHVSHGVIQSIRDDGGGGGDAVHVRVGEASLSHLHLERLEGVGVMAAQGAKVTARDLSIQHVTWAGVLAETGAELDVVSFSVQRSKGSAVAVPGNAKVFVDALVASDNAQGTVWVECGQGAELWLGRVRAKDVAALQSRCVGRGRGPRTQTQKAPTPPE